jgi:hypothetical protein
MRSLIAELTGRPTTSRQIAIGMGSLIAVEVLLGLLGLFMPIKPLLRGWLVAFAIWSMIPVGSMMLLLIRRLTGGEWGQAAAPVLKPAAAMLPLVGLAFVPVLVGMTDIYPWAAEPSSIPADVARWYLRESSFALRAIIALAGWSVLGIVFAVGLGSRLLAGLGLAFFGLTISLVAVDWYLSLEPHYVSSAFAAMIAIQQLLAALAFTALIGTPLIEGKVAGDLGALVIATLLGVVYLELMSFVVAWYGDLPAKAAWFLKRSGSGWIAVLTTAIALGAVLPFGMLLVKAIRCSRRGLRVAGSLILFGSLLHILWVLVPAFDLQVGTVVVACLALLALTLVSLMTGVALGPMLETRHAE